MKKTIIALFAMAGLAAAAETQEFTLSGTEAGCIISPDADTATPFILTYVGTDAVGGNAGDSEDLWLTDTNGYVPKIRLDQKSDGAYYWTITATIKNTEETELTLNSCSVGLYSCTSDGSAQNYEKSILVDLTLGTESKTEQELTLGTKKACNNDASITLVNPIVLKKDESVDVSIKVYRPADWLGQHDAHTYAGLHSVKIGYQTIPEPTTATLSLLALAGLAARRRRK